MGRNLLEINQSYLFILQLIERSTSESYSVSDCWDDIEKLEIKKDKVGICEYINKRMDQNDIKRLINLKNDTISPQTYSYLLRIRATSIAVDRSFLLLKEMLGVKRHFNKQNIEKYMFLYYNDF